MIWNVELCVAGGNVKTEKLFLFWKLDGKAVRMVRQDKSFQIEGMRMKMKEKTNDLLKIPIIRDCWMWVCMCRGLRYSVLGKYFMMNGC